LQARQPDIASLTSCEKSYSPLRACQLLRVRATSEMKVSNQRIHSPKGRATLVREWLRLLADRGVDPNPHRTFYVKVEAQPVAITLHRPAPAAAHRDGDLPIPFNFDVKSPMCPSMKVSNQRIHSPKGRATLVRECLCAHANCYGCAPPASAG
jgi:Fe-S oxidoreductase